MSRSVFYGVSAFVGVIRDATTCTFWPDDPAKIGFGAPQFQVDLSKTPEALRRGTLQGPIEVDDFAGYGTGGLTTIGPMFPGGAMMGLCYVEDSRCAGLGAYDPRAGGPNAGPGYAYEWCTVVYHDSNGTPPALTGRRFHGFHAEIKNVYGNIAMVSLWARGTSAMKPPMGTWPIDLASLAHPVAAGFTTIGVAAGQPKVGALFLDLMAGGGGVTKFDSPKSPKNLGGIVAMGTRRVR